MHRNNAVFYLRLSKEDDKLGESASIENQREILHQYLQKTQFIFSGEYVDDGYSGTNMDRPAFKQMIKDIESGKVGVVLTKDFSRLGRNSGRVQMVIDEVFLKNRVEKAPGYWPRGFSMRRKTAFDSSVKTGSGC